MFCFLSFGGALSLKHQIRSTAGKPEEKKEEMAEGSGTGF